MRHDSTNSRTSQRSRILALLIEARGGWVALPEILQLGVAQYNSRLFELRRLGFHIENRHDGKQRSAFRLVPGQSVPTRAPMAAACPTESLFGDLSPEGSYPD